MFHTRSSSLADRFSTETSTCSLPAPYRAVSRVNFRPPYQTVFLMSRLCWTPALLPAPGVLGRWGGRCAVAPAVAVVFAPGRGRLRLAALAAPGGADGRPAADRPPTALPTRRG